jgi:chromosome segregation ATPase
VRSKSKGAAVGSLEAPSSEAKVCNRDLLERVKKQVLQQTQVLQNALSKAVEELNGRIISLDLQTEELKKAVRTTSKRETVTDEVKQIRVRQNEFIINELEDRMAKLTNENDRLEKLLLEKNLQIDKLSQERDQMEKSIGDLQKDKAKENTKKEQLIASTKRRESQAEERMRGVLKQYEDSMRKMEAENEKLLKAMTNNNLTSLTPILVPSTSTN